MEGEARAAGRSSMVCAFESAPFLGAARALFLLGDAMLILLSLLACFEGAADTAEPDRAALSREAFVLRFGPAWCSAQAECVVDGDGCASDQSAIVDEFCADYNPAAGAACIEALEDAGPGGLCEVYPERVRVACGDACGW